MGSLHIIHIPAPEPGDSIQIIFDAPIIGPPPQPPPPTGIEWDSRLDLLGVKLHQIDVPANGVYFKLIKARWYNEAESQGRHHIYFDVLDAYGQRLTAIWIRITNGGISDILTEAKPGELWSANLPMSGQGTLGAYTAHVLDGPSDVVSGLGLGTPEQPRYAIHTSFGLTYQRKG